VRRGYLFSILIALMLAMLVLLIESQLIFAQPPEVANSLFFSRNITLLKATADIGADLPFNVTRGGYTLVEEARTATELTDLNTRIGRWNTLLTEFDRLSDVNVTNVTIDSGNASTYLGAGLLTLANNDSRWEWRNSVFYLDHSGNHSMLNDTIANVLNTVGCSFNSSGDVSVRVIVNNYDSGERWVQYGQSYDCFLNFSEAEHAHARFSPAAQLSLDCSACPASFTHRVEWNTTDSKLYVLFGDENVTTTTTVNPGWTAPPYPTGTAATKHYGSSASYNLIVFDANADGRYDTAFVDADKDGDFTENTDLRHVKSQSVADYGGKAFYTTIDSSGNWVFISKALAVRSTGVQAVTL
jgi:hypothetical protein